MARVFLNGSRILPEAIVGWIYNHATRNYWRVANWCEFDDLVQDGLMKAYQCLDRYGEPGVDIDPPHFMALVKTAFYRHITEMLRDSRAEQTQVVRIGDAAGEMSDDEYLDYVAESTQPEQEMTASLTELIAGMPEALRRVVELYLTRPEALLKRAGRVLLSGEGETEAQKLNRLAGFPLRHDFETQLRAYLWESENLA